MAVHWKHRGTIIAAICRFLVCASGKAEEGVLSLRQHYLEQVQRVWSRSRAALSAFAPYCVRRPVGSPVTIRTVGPSRDEVKYVREEVSRLYENVPLLTQ